MSRAAAKRRPVRAPARGKKKSTGSWRLSPAAWWRMWVLCGWAATVLLLVWGLDALRDYVQAQPQEGPTHLVWEQLPTWLSSPAYGDVLVEIESDADLYSDDPVADPELTERVGLALSASPWVAEVHQVVKGADGAVRVAAEFREPFAYVAINGWTYLVDKAGVRLPNEGPLATFPEDEWFIITGVRGDIPELGQPWPGEDMAGGLALARFLDDARRGGQLPFRSSLRAIDVANYDLKERPLDGRLRIRTIHPGCYVRWGEPPGEGPPVEPTAQRKLELLTALYVDRGQLPERILEVRREDRVAAERPAGR